MNGLQIRATVREREKRGTCIDYGQTESRDLQSPGSPDITRQALMSIRGESRRGFAP